MEHDEQKIEEIMTQLSPSAGMSHRIFGAEVARQYAEHIRKQTIEECKKCLVIPCHYNGVYELGATEAVEDTLLALNDLE